MKNIFEIISANLKYNMYEEFKLGCVLNDEKLELKWYLIRELNIKIKLVINLN